MWGHRNWEYIVTPHFFHSIDIFLIYLEKIYNFFPSPFIHFFPPLGDETRNVSYRYVLDPDSRLWQTIIDVTYRPITSNIVRRLVSAVGWRCRIAPIPGQLCQVCTDGESDLLESTTSGWKSSVLPDSPQDHKASLTLLLRFSPWERKKNNQGIYYSPGVCIHSFCGEYIWKIRAHVLCANEGNGNLIPGDSYSVPRICQNLYKNGCGVNVARASRGLDDLSCLRVSCWKLV